jgi:hypothetical protein
MIRDGGIEFTAAKTDVSNSSGSVAGPPSQPAARYPVQPWQPKWYHRFVAFWTWDDSSFGSVYSVELAAWIPFLLLCVLPLGVVLRRVRRGRRWAATNRCSSCGYRQPESECLDGLFLNQQSIIGNRKSSIVNRK